MGSQDSCFAVAEAIQLLLCDYSVSMQGFFFKCRDAAPRAGADDFLFFKVSIQPSRYSVLMQVSVQDCTKVPGILKKC